jgi:hypothetical protein
MGGSHPDRDGIDRFLIGAYQRAWPSPGAP